MIIWLCVLDVCVAHFQFSCLITNIMFETVSSKYYHFIFTFYSIITGKERYATDAIESA